MSDLCDKPATELRSLIGRKDISPVELVESCIKRIEATDKALLKMIIFRSLIHMCIKYEFEISYI